MTTEVVVFGAGGYSGMELVRWLARHPEVEVAGASSDQWAGRQVAEEVFEHPEGLRFTTHVETLARTHSGQLAFLATPARTAAELAPTLLERGLRVVDLSGAHRLSAAQYPEWYGFEHPFPASLDEAVYGLPELGDPERIAGARLVANPGCYATAAALAAAPLIEADLVVRDAPVFIDGKSGATGAGRSVDSAFLFSEVADDVRPYRIGHHQHTPEIERILETRAGRPVTVSLNTHLAPLRRGLLCSVYAVGGPGTTAQDVTVAFEKRYASTALVRLRQDGPPGTQRTLGSPHAEVWAHFDGRTRAVSAFAVIDNLVKGAAGQAVQNLNLMSGWPLDTGLRCPAGAPRGGTDGS